MRKSQCDRMLEAMSSGRWTPNERFIEMHIPDYRRRMVELKERYPGRFERRLRDRKRTDGTTYRMADWRDIAATYDFAAVVDPQIAEHRAWLANHEEPTAAPLPVVYRDETLYLTAGQVRFYGDEELRHRLFAAYVDPWRGVGVV